MIIEGAIAVASLAFFAFAIWRVTR